MILLLCVYFSPSSDPPFDPKPSLQLIANHLVVDCLRRYPLEECPLCNQRALPENPKVCSYMYYYTVILTSHKRFAVKLFSCNIAYRTGTCGISCSILCISKIHQPLSLFRETTLHIVYICNEVKPQDYRLLLVTQCAFSL
jgi:hypothetical protein